jgi:hypothetical protein
MAGPGEKKGAGKGKQLPAERTATSTQGGGRQQGVPAQEAEARVAPPVELGGPRRTSPRLKAQKAEARDPSPVEAGGRRRGPDGVPAPEPVPRTGSSPPETALTSGRTTRVNLSHHESARLGLLARRCGLIRLLSLLVPDSLQRTRGGGASQWRGSGHGWWRRGEEEGGPHGHARRS